MLLRRRTSLSTDQLKIIGSGTDIQIAPHLLCCAHAVCTQPAELLAPVIFLFKRWIGGIIMVRMQWITWTGDPRRVRWRRPIIFQWRANSAEGSGLAFLWRARLSPPMLDGERSRTHLRMTPQVSQILGGTIWEPTCQYDFEVHLPHFLTSDGGTPRRTHIRPTPQVSERLRGISNWEPTCQCRRRSSEVDLPHLVTPKKHAHLSCVAKLTPPIRLFFSCTQKIKVGSLFPSIFLSPSLFLFSLSPRFKTGKEIADKLQGSRSPHNLERCEFRTISA